MRSKKKSDQLAPIHQAISSDANTQLAVATESFKRSGRKIKEGLCKQTASTGIPMDQIHGGAKFMAQMSNIGGGSVATGGGGIKDGFSTVLEFTAASAEIETLSPKVSQPELELPE